MNIDTKQKKKFKDTTKEDLMKFRDMYENAPLAYFSVGADGYIRMCNPLAGELLGYPREELIGKMILDLYADTLHGKEKARDILQRFRSGETIRDEELQMEKADGTLVWINLSVNPVRDMKGKILESCSVVSDITERKKTEQTLREQSLTISSAPDAVFSTNKSFIIRSWNKAAESMFGWKAEEVIGKASTSIFEEEYPTLDGITREQALEQLKQKGFWKGEITYHKKDGSPIPVSVSHSFLKDENGTYAGAVTIAHDITARKKREELLAKTQHDLNHAQAVAKTGSWRLDTQRNVLVWSDENHRIFGVRKGKPMTYEAFLSIVHPEDRDYVDAKWKAGLRGETYDIEHRIIVNGETKYVREKAELEFDSDGNLLGGFGTTQEITDIVKMRKKIDFYTKHLEDLVEEKTERLKEAERLAAIGQTAAMVGHDIRNPLQTIVGELYVAKSELNSLPENETKESLKESCDLIEKQVGYINKIVSDLQDFTKPLKPQFEEVDIVQLVQETAANINIPNSVKFVFSEVENFPRIMTDQGFMRRIMVNLLTNAVQAMPNGGILTVALSLKTSSVTIVVGDTGEGVPESIKSKVFVPLFTTKSKGQGLGLPVVKRLITALNGDIWFESQIGKGTRFTIEIPVKPE